MPCKINAPWPDITDISTAHALVYLAIWPPDIQKKFMAEIKNAVLHPNQILLRRSKQHKRDTPSAVIATGKEPYEVLFVKCSASVLISSPSSVPRQNARNLLSSICHNSAKACSNLQKFISVFSLSFPPSNSKQLF